MPIEMCDPEHADKNSKERVWVLLPVEHAAPLLKPYVLHYGRISQGMGRLLLPYQLRHGSGAMDHVRGAMDHQRGNGSLFLGYI